MANPKRGGVTRRHVAIQSCSLPLQNIPANRKALQELAREIVEAAKRPKFELELPPEPEDKSATVLFDHNGDPIFDGAVTMDEVKDAMRAASDAERYDQAEDIAKRYGLGHLCPRCANLIDPPNIIISPYAEGSPFQPRSFDAQVLAEHARISREKATTVHCHGHEVRLCEPCFKEVEQPKLDFSGMKMMMDGLISRTVI